MYDRDCFDREIGWIHDEKIRRFAQHCIANLPSYFFTVPASSSGKYHPSYALGDGGLIRHTLAAVKIAHELLNLEMFQKQFTQEERDLIILSLINHDGVKQGSTGKHTVFDHPLCAADFIKRCNIETGLLSDEQEKIVYDAIASHMGEWNTAAYSKAVLPKPQTKIQKFVHMCDYLASRKYLEVNFDAMN